MKRFYLYGYILVHVVILLACSAERKSALYYQKNRVAINEVRSYFEILYKQQPFAVGFTDKTCKYLVLQVNTDTVRYVYNTENSINEMWQLVSLFRYDTTLLNKLALKMRNLKCLWLGKDVLYLGEKREMITFLSFKSVLIDKPFVENKYYVLIFPDHKMDHPDIKARIRKGEIVKIDESVYFMIGDRYR